MVHESSKRLSEDFIRLRSRIAVEFQSYGVEILPPNFSSVFCTQFNADHFPSNKRSLRHSYRELLTVKV